ncbi:MAG: cache domain-containing protein [Candidatus Nealsonbacteria bacterium]|nr:cache domain-containing protein [Candidatus Nealsonbacteria bacterium]
MENNRFRTIRRMILSRGLLAPFVALMLVCATLVYYFASYSRDQVQTTLVRIASGHRHLVDQFLDERASDLRFAAASCSIEEISNRADLTELFRNLQAGSEAFFDLGVFDDTGNHLEYVGPYDLAGKNYAEAEWFKAVQEEGLYVSDVFLGHRKIPHFIIAVRRREGDRTWYLRATIDTLSFNGLVEGIRMAQTGEAYLVNRKGVLQTARRSGGKLMESDPDFNTYVIDDENVTSFSAGRHSQQRYLYATGPLKHADWVLVVRQEVGDAYGPVTRAVVIAVAVILVGGTVAGFMAYILASGLANALALADIEKQHIKTQLVKDIRHAPAWIGAIFRRLAERND